MWIEKTLGLDVMLVEKFRQGAPLDEWNRLVYSTKEYFKVWDGDVIIAIGGCISYGMLSKEEYFWMRKLDAATKLSSLRAALGLAREYLSSRVGDVFAECALGAKRNEKFLEALGFRYVDDLGDRLLFEWKGE